MRRPAPTRAAHGNHLDLLAFSLAKQRKRRSPESRQSSYPCLLSVAMVLADSDLPRACRRHHQLHGELTVFLVSFVPSLLICTAPCRVSASVTARARHRPSLATIGGWCRSHEVCQPRARLTRTTVRPLCRCITEPACIWEVEAIVDVIMRLAGPFPFFCF
jgi:hypothetical protein